MDAGGVAYRIFKARCDEADDPMALVGNYVTRFTPAVRKVLNKLGEEGTIDAFDMRRPVKYAYVSDEVKKRRDIDSKERQKEEETVKGILTASSFTDEEIEEVMLGSRVRMSADELQKVFEAGRFLGKTEGK